MSLDPNYRKESSPNSDCKFQDEARQAVTLRGGPASRWRSLKQFLAAR